MAGFGNVASTEPDFGVPARPDVGPSGVRKSTGPRSRAEASVYGFDEGSDNYGGPASFVPGTSSFSSSADSSKDNAYDSSRPYGLGNSRPQFVGFGNSGYPQVKG